VELTRREIEANGTRLYVETAGSGEPLVFVHGFSLDTRMWDDQWEPFAEHFQVVRYDLRGFGRSALPTDQYYRHADDLAGLLDALGIQRAHVVGLSLGGGITLDFALAHHQRVLSLVVVDGILPGFSTPDLDASIGTVWRAARSEPLEAVKELWLSQPLFSGALADPSVAARVRAMVADYSGYGWVARDPGRWVDPPVASRLAEISAPTLALAGEGDLEGFKTIAGKIAAEVPGARLAMIPGCGHLPNMEAPDAFNAALFTGLGVG
jgi:pimeloyl-ACP methyl ester carboxylesterase